HKLNLPAQGETIFFAGCGYQFSAQLEKLMSLARGVDKTVIGAELPMRFARFQKKLHVNLPVIYSNVLSLGGVSEVKPLVAAIKVLNKMGIQPAYLGKNEPCCGATLYHAGMQDKFTENANKAYKSLKDAGVKNIISVVPYCTHALQKLFPAFVKDYDIEVRHFLDIVAEKISLFQLRYPRPVRVTYHDPCQMVRYMNLIEEPRRILRAIGNVTLVEPEWTRGEYATCCGGGGGFETVFPELSEVLAVNRVTELMETKPDIIVTHCPGCIMQLKDGLHKLKVEGVEVLDLMEVVATAMEA
ncbi:MAG: (Fe-S)-binding protein, partial [Dehalococcoidales bacterium]|nr:(Fe-S)-binding protein [Dehalococcoidales bacterium]